MKLCHVVLVVLLVSSVGCNARKRHSQRGERHISARLDEDVGSDSPSESQITTEGTPSLQHPCSKVHCKSGKECTLDEHNNARCECIHECPDELAIDDAVCGTDNQTYSSECELRRIKCLGSPDKSTRQKLRRLKMNYLGPCKALTQCKKSEFVEYPIRMRSWLKNIFLEMYDTPESEGGLNEKQRHHGRKVYEERERLQNLEEEGPQEMLEREFQKFYQLYKYPIHWKFAELDKKGKDRQLSKRELEPLRAPLIPLEHCAKSFFKRADKNKDKKISLEEWCRALGLKQGDIDPRLVF